MSNEFKVVINESLDSKLIDRVVQQMANDMDDGDASSVWELLHILAISSPANRKTILQYLPEEEWDDYVIETSYDIFYHIIPANYKEQ